jgi:hypothetical protein
MRFVRPLFILLHFWWSKVKGCFYLNGAHLHAEILIYEIKLTRSYLHNFYPTVSRTVDENPPDIIYVQGMIC